jgi:hypothetical protein
MSSILDGVTRPARGGVPFKNPVPHGTPGGRNRVRVRTVKPDGTVRDDSGWIDNIMTTFGLASMASRIGTASGANNNSTEFVSAIKIGTGATAAASTDVSLVASTGSVTIGNASFTKTNLGNRTVEYRATFASDNPANNAVINEIGLYLNSTADNTGCAARSVLGASSVNKLSSDVINCSYQWIWTTA